MNNTAICLKETEGMVICAWCGKDLGTKEDMEGVGHGICPECKKKHFPELDKNKGGQETIGVRMNLSRERIRQIEQEALARMRGSRDLWEVFEDLEVAQATTANTHN